MATTQSNISGLLPGFLVREETPTSASAQTQRLARACRCEQNRTRRTTLLRGAFPSLAHAHREQGHRWPLRRRKHRERDATSTDTAASLIAEEPKYAKLAAHQRVGISFTLCLAS